MGTVVVQIYTSNIIFRSLPQDKKDPARLNPENGIANNVEAFSSVDAA